jgi:two-component system, NtrC family, response regulator HydG
MSYRNETMNQRSPSLLIVDDEVDTCLNYADILTDLGYAVDTAHAAVPALQSVRKRAYDVALLDLKMPDMDGLTLYREIKKLRAATAAIIITGFATNDVVKEALAAGVMHVISKPAAVPKLMELIERALSRPLILLVEDDEDLCDSLWDLMHERGYRVCIAHDETAAAERLNSSNYNVVLIDMKLPVGDGRGVFRVVKQTNPTARVIVVTGFRTERDDDVRQLAAEGAEAIHYKPFDIPELLGTVERLAGGR